MRNDCGFAAMRNFKMVNEEKKREKKRKKEKKGRIVRLQFYIKRKNGLNCFVVQNLQEAGMTIILKKNGCQNENK